MSSTDVLIHADVISTKQSIFSSQIRTPSFSINWPSLVSTAQSLIMLWRLWSHKPSHKHDSNKCQSKAFVICDHKSDETKSVKHENKAYLVWLMFRMLINQHCPHLAGKGFLLSPPPPPSPSFIFIFFLLLSQLSRRTSGGTASYAGYKSAIATLSFKKPISLPKNNNQPKNIHGLG